MTQVGLLAGCALVVVLTYQEIALARDRHGRAEAHLGGRYPPALSPRGETILLVVLTAITALGVGPHLWGLLT